MRAWNESFPPPHINKFLLLAEIEEHLFTFLFTYSVLASSVYFRTFLYSESSFSEGISSNGIRMSSNLLTLVSPESFPRREECRPIFVVLWGLLHLRFSTADMLRQPQTSSVLELSSTCSYLGDMNLSGLRYKQYRSYGIIPKAFSQVQLPKLAPPSCCIGTESCGLDGLGD